MKIWNAKRNFNNRSEEKMRKHSRMDASMLEKIEEQIIGFVARYPRKMVPVTTIASNYGATRGQVSNVVKRLVRRGALIRLSRYTYKLPVPRGRRPVRRYPTTDDAIQEFKTVLSLTSPPPGFPRKPKVSRLADQVEALAKDFKWETDSDSVRGFVRWLNNKDGGKNQNENGVGYSAPEVVAPET